MTTAPFDDHLPGALPTPDLAAATSPSGLVAMAGVLLAAGLLAFAPFSALLGALLVATGVAVLVWPALGLAIAAIGVPFASEAALPVSAGALTFTPLVLVLATAGWLTALVLARRKPSFPRGLILALGLFIGALSLSALRAPSILNAGFEIARWLELGLALLVAAGLAHSPRASALVIAALLVAGTAGAAVGIEMAVQREGPEAFEILGGRAYRAHGTFGQPNPFGAYMNMVWPVGVGLLLAMVATEQPKRASRAVRLAWAGAGAITAGVAGLGLALSWSRGAWLAAAAGAGLMVLAYVGGAVYPRPDARRLGALWLAGAVTLTLLLFGAARFFPGAVVGRLASVADTFVVWDVRDAEVSDANFATVERVAHWQAAGTMWADKPWLGQGPGHYELLYDEYRLPRWSEALGHAHNYYLNLLAEAGLLGLTAYALFLGAALTFAVRTAVRPRSALQAGLAFGLIGVLGAIFVHSFTDNVFVHETVVHLGLLLGLTHAAGGNL